MTKDKKQQIISLALEFGVLKKVIRTGWKKKGIKDPESVADHTWRVAMLAMVLAPELNLDQNKLIKMALIHDLGEALIGDIIWEKGKKIIGSQEEKHRDERSAIESIFNTGDMKEYRLLWEEFEHQETIEAKLIKELDKLEMAIQALEYEKEGYSGKKLDEFWENAEKYLKKGEVASIFLELKKIRG